MRSCSLSKTFIIPMRALTLLTGYKQIQVLVPSLSIFNPTNQNAKTIQVLSLLGPFILNSSPFGGETDKELAFMYFPPGNINSPEHFIHGETIGTRNESDVKSALNILASISSNASNQLSSVILSFIKSSVENRTLVLKYFSDCIKLNNDRAKLHVDRRNVCTDGFMHRISTIFFSLCKPIVDVNHSKVHLIDKSYITNEDCFIDISTRTRINAAQPEIDEQMISGTSNFVSHVFYLAGISLNLGLCSIIRYCKDLGKEIDHISTQIQSLVSNDPLTNALKNNHVKRFDQLIAIKLTYDSQLKDINFINDCLSFYNLTCVFILHCVYGNDDILRNNNSVKVSDDAKNFRMLPEYILEDVLDYYIFVCRNNPIVFENALRNEILAVCICVLQNPGMVKNPYLKSKLVEILFYFTLPLYKTSNGEHRGRLDSVFSGNKLCREYLVDSVLRFYVGIFI